MSKNDAFKQEAGFYRILFENIPIAIQINQLIFNETGEPVDYLLLDINHAAEKHFGFNREEIVGKRIKEIYSVVEKEWFTRYGQAVKAGKADRFEIYSEALGRWYDVQVIPLEGPDKFGIFYQDITELKNKEASEKKALIDRKIIEIEKEHYMRLAKEKAAWLQTIMDLIPAGVWISDPDGKVIMINKEAINMYRGGSSISDVPKEYNSYKIFLPDSDERIFFEPYPPKESVIGMVLDFERFDGTRGTMVASTEAISDKAGKIINYVAVAMDITTLRQAEKALEKSEKNALDLVEKLRQVDQNKNAFINRLSHELRNPLASIMMALELIEKTPSGSQQALKALDIVKRQSKLLKNLVDDLLDVTRITQNKVCLKKDVLEINNLVEKVIQDYQPQFIEKNVKLEFKSSLPIYMKADYSRLTQAIGNLLHNAAKFTNEDDLVIVSVAQDADCSEAVITVEDTGQGMDPKDQLNLFKPFMQADKPLGLRHEGLGLGLSIVKGIVEHHGGRVEAFSEGLGRGAKFTIRLPL
jgi:PAS domain S-box-containing protein